MKESIIKTLADIKEFMTTSTQSNYRQPSKFAIGDKSFTRNRKLPMLTIVCLLLLQVKKSLAINVDEFFTRWGAILPGSSNEGYPTPEAVCKRRTFLDPEIFHYFLTQSAASFYRLAEGLRWGIYRLLSIDGSTISLPDTPLVAKEFGTSKHNRDSRPFARVSLLFDPLNRLICDGILSPGNSSELEIGMRIVAKCAAKDILFVLDRLYASFRLVKLCLRKGCKFVCRAKSTMSLSVKEFVASKEYDSDIMLTANYKSVKGLKSLGLTVHNGDSISVRAVKIILPSGETEILLTNLTRAEASVQDLSNIYQMRWPVEESYEILKNEEQIEIFTGFRPICIKQDFFAALFLYNIESLISKLDDETLDRINQIKKSRKAPPVQIDINFTWHVLRDHFCQWVMATASQANEILLKMSDAFLIDLIESNVGKHRKRIKRAIKLNGKFITFTNYKQAV